MKAASTPLFGRASTAVIYGFLATTVLIPIFSVRVPCLGDYLNHLARIHILLTIPRSPALQQFYDPHWHLVPYLGMDLFIAAAAQFMDIYAAGRLFIATCVMMPVIAAGTLHYALYRRIGLAPVLAFLLCYNFDLALGFVNYLFSACLAIMLFAGWIACAGWPVWRRGVVFAAATPILFLSHSFAFPVYGLLVLGWELAQFTPRHEWRKLTTSTAAAALQIFPPLVLNVMLRAQGTFGHDKITLYGSPPDRIAAYLSPIYFPGPVFLAPAILAALLIALWLAGRPQIPKPIILPLALTIAAALAAPHVLLNIWGTDLRMPLVAAILLTGAAVPSPTLTRRRATVILAGLAALMVTRAETTCQLLRGLDAQIAQIREVVSVLPLSQRVLLIQGPQNAPAQLAPRGEVQHMGLVAAIDRDSFIPTLFVGTTPLRLLETMQNSTSQGVQPIGFNELEQGDGATPATTQLPDSGYGGQQYWLGWPQKFDDVLVINFGGVIPALPSKLHKIAGNQTASLYRISAE